MHPFLGCKVEGTTCYSFMKSGKPIYEIGKENSYKDLFKKLISGMAAL